MAAQPDFNNVSQALQTIQNEIGLVQNMPAVQGQQQLAQQVQQVTTQMTAQTAQMTAQTAQMTAQGVTLAALTAQLAAYDHNSMARALNTSAIRNNSRLTPLRAQNNQVPNGFPATLTALNGLNVAQMNALLTAYALPIAGTLPVKRQSFRRFIGIGVET